MIKQSQRKGQWLINKIREANPNVVGEDYPKIIENIIWNMSNDEFDAIFLNYGK